MFFAHLDLDLISHDLFCVTPHSDGDILSLYYRDDVLRHFNLTVPRTWEEYNAVAKAVHDKVYENTTLVGSCVGRVKDFAGPYWANLVISSLTQTRGQWEGHLFSSNDLHPLTGPAIEKALEWMEEQVMYGSDDGTFVVGRPQTKVSCTATLAIETHSCCFPLHIGFNQRQSSKMASHSTLMR